MEGNGVRRKRASSPTAEDPFPKRRCILKSTNGDAAFREVKSHQGPIVVSNVRTTGVPLFSSAFLVGRFDEYVKYIWSWLMDNHVSRIGIYGIAGVGKTEFAKFINNKLLQNPNRFHHVFWVVLPPVWRPTVSNLRRICDLQGCISKVVGVRLSEGDSATVRAAQLSKGLSDKENPVLILDGVWGYISLLDVGIPDQCTVVFTTQSLQMCTELSCQRNLEIRCLLPDESYELFKNILGKETILSEEVEKISRSVADKCAGLPLAITIMSRYMKGITGLHRWTDALGGQTQKNVYREISQKLKIGYGYLEGALQCCFLYCLLFVQDETEKRGGYFVTKRRLVEYLVDEGIIPRKNSRREELVDGLWMLNRLHAFGLLEITSCNFVRMNPMIRSMALHIMEEDQQCTLMVKNKNSLKEVPDEETWNEDLVGVSLKGNEIVAFPSDFSPTCPKLSTLLLSQNPVLSFIGDDFFKGMPALKVLDISGTNIESLPRSIIDLVNLTTLLLSCCVKLKKITLAEKMKALRKLDLSFSGVIDIEAPSKLTYLDLYQTQVKELNSEILAKFCNLQFLRLPLSFLVKSEGLSRLSRLESLTCSFNDVIELNNYLEQLEGDSGRPQLHVHVGQGPTCYATKFASPLFNDDSDFLVEGDADWSVVGLYNCNINEVNLRNYFQDVKIVKCDEATSLCKFFPIQGTTELKHFSIRDCDRLEFLCSSSLTDQGIFEKIECMKLFNLVNFRELFKTEGNINAAYGFCFSNLTQFLIQLCPGIKQLFPIHIWQNLKNLKQLYVIDCCSMKEIFAAAEEGEEESSIVGKKRTCYLPKLSMFQLVNLPVLKTVCGEGATWTLPRSCTMQTKNCPTLSLLLSTP
ncbi:Disease resistance protein (CC-NBS-LRR class) family [Euphorbia peplus]|nr:Disease resistance protein (CC-NBS-LRR class) family [Euphorbia peplus]